MTDSSAFIGKKISFTGSGSGWAAAEWTNKKFLLPDGVTSVMSPEKYTYTRSNVRRNIYRVPVE